MVYNKKIERASSGPGIFAIIFGALLSLVLGVVLAMAYLVAKPVEVVKELPKEPVKGVVYYIEGSSNSSKARQWSRKRQMLVGTEPAELVFVEDELNAWIGSVMTQGGPEAKSGAAAIVPNVRIYNGTLQVGFSAMYEYLDTKWTTALQTSGRFVNTPEGPRFSADEAFFGSLPIHRLPGYDSFMIQEIILGKEIPEEIRRAWNRVTEATIDQNSLRLVLK
ncbi:MAG: hypothetical protein K0R17_703 [Rariglobus sp.]|jgi:hypothetical protein|nr:hypothetical protein [Rariglobus sp.]